MAVFMSLRPMPGMVVIVPSMLSCMIVVMDLAPPAVTVFVNMLMEMFVLMGVGVFVAMFLFIMRVFVGVSM